MDVDLTDATDEQSELLASQACTACRKQKRKCDKKLPTCSLCQRIGRECDYSVDVSNAVPSLEDFQALQQRVEGLEELLREVASSKASDVGDRASTGDSQGSTNGIQNGDYGAQDNGLASTSAEPSTSLPFGALASPLLPSPTTFPNMLFLDSAVFDYLRMQVYPKHIPLPDLPDGPIDLLNDPEELKHTVQNYFVTVHSYLPIISKIRLYQNLSILTHSASADLALLFLCMKLITRFPSHSTSPEDPLYHQAKTLYTHAESAKSNSIHLLQSLLLLALYELGHGIYPAAYLSIGHAARLGYALGVHDRQAPQMLPRCTTWTEQEERRRVWWAVVLLDRFINTGHRGKPFASAEPSLQTHLPTDDEAWDKGQMLGTTPLALSAAQTVQAGFFARTCQAAHLLGKVVRHIDDQSLPLDYRFDEALQLHRTCRSFAVLLPQEAEKLDLRNGGPGLCSAMGLAYSALLTLYDSYSCTEGAVEGAPATQVVMQKVAIEGLAEVSNMALDLARRVRGGIEVVGLGLECCGPFVIECFYQAAANYAWYSRESSDVGAGKCLAELRMVLTMLDRRWKVAGEYDTVLFRQCHA